VIATNEVEALRASYARALESYLAVPDEGALADAYALGRRALSEGVGLIEWAALHDDIVAALDVAGGERRARAAAFFRESLSPFEMTQRGYAETNRWLERLNEDLRREVAAKERLAAQLQESNAELESFSYSVAHDLRAPLRHIAGFARLLADEHGPRLDEAGGDYLRRIERGVARMNDLIDGLLVLARVVRTEPARVSLDLAEPARAIMARLQQGEPDRKVDAVIPAHVPARGDARLLEAVLENLLGNAWKFTRKKARARVELGVDERRVPAVYFVRDDGAGFDMRHAERLFGVFQRLHGDDVFPGTGIGLATVQRIVRRHGGRIWAESQVGAGATFFFTLEPDSPPVASH
jgi:light-regulated signal transduction histidine kinase (bacteriophytochrome)